MRRGFRLCLVLRDRCCGVVSVEMPSALYLLSLNQIRGALSEAAGVITDNALSPVASLIGLKRVTSLQFRVFAQYPPRRHRFWMKWLRSPGSTMQGCKESNNDEKIRVTRLTLSDNSRFAASRASIFFSRSSVYRCSSAAILADDV